MCPCNVSNKFVLALLAGVNNVGCLIHRHIQAPGVADSGCPGRSVLFTDWQLAKGLPLLGNKVVGGEEVAVCGGSDVYLLLGDPVQAGYDVQSTQTIVGPGGSVG